MGSHSDSRCFQDFFGEDNAFGADVSAGEISDFAVEAFVGERELEGDAGVVDDFLPAGDAVFDLADVVVAKAFVERGERGNLLANDFVADDFPDGVVGFGEDVIVSEFCFAEASFEAAGEIVGGVRGDVGAVEVERYAVMEIEIALDRLEIDDTESADVGGIVDLVFVHDVAGALDYAGDASFADEHVMGFFGEHEAAGAGEWIESGFGERAELKFSVAVGEET